MFKEGDHVWYLSYYDCVVVHKGHQYNGSQMYMIKQLNNNKTKGMFMSFFFLTR